MDVFNGLTEPAASRLRASELAPYVQPFWDRLTELQYSRSTARQYLNCLAHFAFWSRRRPFDLRALDRLAVNFIDQHLPCCTCTAPVQRSRHQVRTALRHLMTVARSAGVQLESRHVGPIDEQLRRLDDYLLHSKGLAGSTRLKRITVIRALLCMTSSEATPFADDLRQFLTQEL